MAELVGFSEQLVEVGLDLLAELVKHGLAGPYRLAVWLVAASAGERARARCERDCGARRS